MTSPRDPAASRRDDPFDAPALDRRIDAALREVAGNERAPDVTAAVLRRLHSGDRGERPAAARPLRHRLLAAALVLLGCGAVLSTILATRDDAPQEAVTPISPQSRGDEPIEVTTLAGVAALPPATTAVALRKLGDDAVAALVRRCPDLVDLRLFASTAFRRSDDPLTALSITDAALGEIASLGKLRRLDLVGTNGVTGPGLQHLQRLPLLAELSLSYFDLDDAAVQVLPRLPSLRGLDLSFDHGFGEAGVAAIAACPGLQRLRLRACSQLAPDWLRQLQRLQQLEELDLTAIGGSWRGGATADEAKRTAEQAQQDHRERPDASQRGVRVEHLSAWPRLLRLALGDSFQLEPEVGRHLHENCPRLREVDLSGCPLVDDFTVAHLLGLRHLRTLDLSRCERVTAISVPLLQQATQLRRLRLHGTPWLTLTHAELLLARGVQVECERPGDAAFAEGLAALRAQYRSTLENRTEQVRSIDDFEALPRDVDAIELRGLGRDALPRLLSFPALRYLSIVRSDVDPRIDDASLAVLAKLPRLEHLHLIALDELRGDCLQHLAVLPALQSLELSGLQLRDETLQVLPRLRALRQLEVTGNRALGDDGVAAIAACRGLQSLSLRSCDTLKAASIARIGALTGLQELDLTHAGQLDDRALQGLAPLVQLRTLLLEDGTFTDEGLQAISGMKHLHTLHLTDAPQLTSSALLQVPVGIEQLALSRTTGMDATAGALLRDRFPGLRHLTTALCTWVDDAVLAAILQLPRLESLTITACDRPTAAVLDAIARCTSLRTLDAQQCWWLTVELQAELQRRRPDLKVSRRNW